MGFKISFIILFWIILGMIATPAFAVENYADNSVWEFKFLDNFDIWNGEVTCIYKGYHFVKGVNTSFWLTVGGGYKDEYFFRKNDGTLYDPLDQGVNLAPYKQSSCYWDFGIKQGLVFDDLNNRNLIEAFVFYKSRSDQNIRSESPEGSLIFQSGLPDDDGILQNTLKVGLTYNSIITNNRLQTKKGVFSQISDEIAPKSLNEIADYTNLNVTETEFIPIVENERFCIYLGDYLRYIQLDGNYIPINARVLGGIRGAGYFADGYIKLVNNFDARFTFPSLINDKCIPGFIFYFDSGVYDNATHKLDY
jgi:hypothetical protein